MGEVFSIMDNILVTGCAGFIGFHLSHRLLAEGFPVIGLDNLNDYYEVSLKEARLKLLTTHPSFRFVRADLADSAKVEQIFSQHKIAQVYNLAAQAGVPYSLENPQAYLDSNVKGFLNVLEACRFHPVKHLLYASSSSVYGGINTVPYDLEQKVDQPLNLYAATKKANELMAHAYSHLYGIPSTGLRFFTVYGPWGRPDMAYFKFTRAILAGQPIKLYNHGQMQRDFTYVDDVVEALVRLRERNPQPATLTSSTPYRLFNVGNNQPISLDHFVTVLEQKLGLTAVRELVPPQACDMLVTYANVDDLIREVGFRPDTPVEEGLGRFVDWYRDYYRLV